MWAKALLLIILAAPLAASGAYGQAAPSAPGEEPPEIRLGPSSQKPYVPSWDKALRRFYERGKQLDLPDPHARTNRALRRLYSDPVRKLGLPENKLPEFDPKAAQPAAPPPLPAEIMALDTNGDDVVTRREYMNRRMRYRPVPAGAAVVAQRRNYRGRIRSRFTGADIDGNGFLSTEELRGVRDPRF